MKLRYFIIAGLVIGMSSGLSAAQDPLLSGHDEQISSPEPVPRDIVIKGSFQVHYDIGYGVIVLLCMPSNQVCLIIHTAGMGGSQEFSIDLPEGLRYQGAESCSCTDYSVERSNELVMTKLEGCKPVSR